MRARLADGGVDDKLDFPILDRVFDIRPSFVQLQYLSRGNASLGKSVVCPFGSDNVECQSLERGGRFDYTALVHIRNSNQHASIEREAGIRCRPPFFTFSQSLKTDDR